MTDKEIWLIFFHAILSRNVQSGLEDSAAWSADAALEQYKKRWEEDQEEVEDNFMDGMRR